MLTTCRRATPMFQSTPPRGGRPAFGGFEPLLHRVSIHAPAWGATIEPVSIEELVYVSIHAPAWGATIAILHGLW
jgi:hypothetical protein